MARAFDVARPNTAPAVQAATITVPNEQASNITHTIISQEYSSAVPNVDENAALRNTNGEPVTNSSVRCNRRLWSTCSLM